jgi:hypothetical protein
MRIELETPTGTVYIMHMGQTTCLDIKDTSKERLQNHCIYVFGWHRIKSAS